MGVDQGTSGVGIATDKVHYEMISFNLEIKNLDVLRRLADQFPIVGVRSLNRVIKSAKTEASRSIRETYNIKKKDVDPYMRIKSASRGRLISKILLCVAAGTFLITTRRE